MMAEQKKERLHALVEGLVQGVGFRYFVSYYAEELQLTGWVRNLWDGRVEILAEGTRTVLEKMLEHLQKGPRGAQVSKVDVQWQAATNEFMEFRIPPSIYKMSEDL
jgi:acylphosphatase